VSAERSEPGGRDRPTVSVHLITYNQETYIGQALDSALMQRTTFDWELVVGEDCSTDRTRDIVVEYARRHPERIRTLLHPSRLGPHAFGMHGKNNFIATYRACRGRYVALLEGDDYWTDDTKLQKQVDFLERHGECTLCCHPVAVEYSGGRAEHWPSVIGAADKGICTLEDILRLESKPELPTSSMMLRRDSLPDFPAWFHDVFNGDYAIQVLLAERGPIGFLADCMAVHRKHAEGVTRLYETDPDFCNDKLLILHRAVDRHLDYRYHAILRPYIAEERKRQARARARARAAATPTVAGADRRPRRAPRFDVLTALANQGELVSAAAHRLADLRRAVGSPVLTWTEWLLLFAAAVDFRPDLIVELGRAHGDSTCLLTEAAHVLDGCRVRSYGDDSERAYETSTLPRLRPLVPPGWLGRQEIIHADITLTSGDEMFGDARRVFLFWNAHGAELARHVLAEVLPALEGREHVILVHDIHDARNERLDPAYVTGEGTPSHWQSGLMSPYDEMLPILDFVSRNRIRLDTPARAARRRGGGRPAGRDVLSPTVREVVASALDLFPSDSTAVALASFSCNDRASSRRLVFPSPGVWTRAETGHAVGQATLDAGSSIELNLAEFAPGAGTIAPAEDGAVRITTAATPWAYAAVLALPAAARAAHGGAPGFLRIHVSVSDGPVGFGVMNRNGTTFLDRRFVTASRHAIDLFLTVPAVLDAGDIVVQTWDRATSGTARIEHISLIVPPPAPGSPQAPHVPSKRSCWRWLVSLARRR
jgi:glycosyltransferase involved in cell wall biosynthesis